MTLCSNCELYREMYQAAKRDAEEAWVYASELEAKLFKTIEGLEVDLAKAVEALRFWKAAYKTGRNEPLVQAFENAEAILAKIGEGHE